MHPRQTAVALPHRHALAVLAVIGALALCAEAGMRGDRNPPGAAAAPDFRLLAGDDAPYVYFELVAKCYVPAAEPEEPTGTAAAPPAWQSRFEETTRILKDLLGRGLGEDEFLAEFARLGLRCPEMGLKPGLGLVSKKAPTDAKPDCSYSANRASSLERRAEGPLGAEEEAALGRVLYHLKPACAMPAGSDEAHLFVAGAGPVGLTTAISECTKTSKPVVVFEKRGEFVMEQYLAAENILTDLPGSFGICVPGGIIQRDYQYMLARVAVLLGVDVRFHQEVLALCPVAGEADRSTVVARDWAGEAGRHPWLVPGLKQDELAAYCDHPRPGGGQYTTSPSFKVVLGADGAADSVVRKWLGAEMRGLDHLHMLTVVEPNLAGIRRTQMMPLGEEVKGLCLIYKFKPTPGSSDGCPTNEGNAYPSDVVTEQDRANYDHYLSLSKHMVTHSNWRGKAHQQCWAELFLNAEGEHQLYKTHEALGPFRNWRDLIERGHAAHLAVVRRLMRGERGAALPDYAEEKYRLSVEKHGQNRTAVLRDFPTPHTFIARLLTASRRGAADALGVRGAELAVDLGVFEGGLRDGFNFMTSWSAFSQEFRAASVPYLKAPNGVQVAVVGDALRDPYFVFGNGLNSAVRHATAVATMVRTGTSPAKITEFSGLFAENYKQEAGSNFFYDTRCNLLVTRDTSPLGSFGVADGLVELMYNPAGTAINAVWPKGQGGEAAHTVELPGDPIKLCAIEPVNQPHHLSAGSKWKAFMKAVAAPRYHHDLACRCATNLMGRCDAYPPSASMFESENDFTARKSVYKWVGMESVLALGCHFIAQ